MTQVVPFLDAVEREWTVLAKDLPAAVRKLDVRRSLDPHKLVIELEWPGHVAAIQAWEHATCLDIDILSTHSKKGVMFVSGPCEDENHAFDRLHRFQRHIVAALANS